MTRTIARWVPENLDRSVDIIVDDSNNIQIRTGTASAPTNLPQLTYDSNSDRKSTRLNSSHLKLSRMPSSA